jgi:hypothetical protein
MYMQDGFDYTNKFVRKVLSLFSLINANTNEQTVPVPEILNAVVTNKSKFNELVQKVFKGKMDGWMDRWMDGLLE